VPDKSVALCDAAAAGCSEYIDPVSKFNPNLVYNPGFIDASSTGWGVGSWNGIPLKDYEQVVSLERNKLYAFNVVYNSSGTSAGGASLSFVRNVRTLGKDNNFSAATTTVKLDGTNQPMIFDSFDNYSVKLVGNGNSNLTTSVRELVINYQLDTNIDKTSCTVTNFDNGCVLFNKRAVSGASGLVSNVYNAAATADKKAPVVSYGPYTANQLLKVRPDRVCAKWLSCTSYALDPDTNKELCYSMGECNLLDDKNECANLIGYNEGESRTFDVKTSQNSSGYALVNQYYYNSIKEVGLNTTAHFGFEESSPSLNCFQSHDDPVWGNMPEMTTKCTFDTSIVKDSLIREPQGAPTDYPASGKSYLRVSGLQFMYPKTLLIPTPGDYYLNYLVNTKNSGVNSKVIVFVPGNVVNGDISQISTISKLSAISGWERKILPFKVINPNSKVTILLGTDSNDSSVVYYDDINIEPVLRIGANKFSARDCRLYPTSESLDCVDKNDTVVKNGLDGYCLEYDLANPKVCQLWMPVDKVASTKLIKSKLGYNGKFPLNYCADVNVNFSFLEKRKAAIVKVESWRRDGDEYLGIRRCYYPAGYSGLQYCARVYAGELANGVNMMSTSTATTTMTLGAGGNSTNASGTSIEAEGSATTTSTYTVYFDTPVSQEVLDREKQGKVCDFENANASTCKKNGGSENINSNPSDTVVQMCGDSGNYFLLEYGDLKQANRGFWSSRDDMSHTWICVPINDFRQATGVNVRKVAAVGEQLTTFDNAKVTPFTDGWYLANGFDKANGEVDDIGDFTYNDPLGFNEFLNDDPPLRILDKNYGTPSNEDGLKKISSNNPDEVFRLTCDKFVEAVSESGENMAYAQRIGKDSLYATNTTAIFKTANIQYNNYVRKLGDIPFGAAAWPDDYNFGSERVPLYNQYSSANKEDVFAGRPYGCNYLDSSTSTLANCSMIGFCSGNPDIYCLTDASSEFTDYKFTGYDLSRQSCGSFGTCQRLWSSYNATGIQQVEAALRQLRSGYETVLGKLFVKWNNSFTYDSNLGGYNLTPGYNLDYNPPAQDKPTVSNVKVYFNTSKTAIPTNKELAVGNYRLEFNTRVNADHQPLNQIIINWGDGFQQVITDQDHHPANPHIFYHYYSKKLSSESEIKIKVYDNWGLYGER
jgi:hypothetical protein